MAKRVIDFSKMEVEELVDLRDRIETALSGKIAAETEELQTRMKDLAALAGKRSSGVKTGRRSGPQSGKGKVHPLKGKKAVAKYRGPNGETWAGRGLTPKWLTALEAKGKKRDSFLIKS